MKTKTLDEIIGEKGALNRFIEQQRREDVLAELRQLKRILSTHPKAKLKCPECRRTLPGHALDCWAGNELAKRYQEKLT